MLYGNWLLVLRTAEKYFRTKIFQNRKYFNQTDPDPLEVRDSHFLPFDVSAWKPSSFPPRQKASRLKPLMENKCWNIFWTGIMGCLGLSVQVRLIILSRQQQLGQKLICINTLGRLRSTHWYHNWWNLSLISNYHETIKISFWTLKKFPGNYYFDWETESCCLVILDIWTHYALTISCKMFSVNWKRGASSLVPVRPTPLHSSNNYKSTNRMYSTTFLS